VSGEREHPNTGRPTESNGAVPLTAYRSPLAAREGQTFGGDSLLTRYVNFVKLPHTLFALPFALLGVLAASVSAPVTARIVALVVLAFSSARWAAMGSRSG